MIWYHLRYIIDRCNLNVLKGQYFLLVLYEDLVFFATILYASSNNDQDLARFDNYGLLGMYILEKIITFYCYYVLKLHVYIGLKYCYFIVKIIIATIECDCCIKFTK